MRMMEGKEEREGGEWKKKKPLDQEKATELACGGKRSGEKELEKEKQQEREGEVCVAVTLARTGWSTTQGQRSERQERREKEKE